MWRIFQRIFSVPHGTVGDLNDVMSVSNLSLGFLHCTKYGLQMCPMESHHRGLQLQCAIVLNKG